VVSRNKSFLHVRHNQRINDVPDPFVIGLQLLGHVVGDPDLGGRFLALTGMDADDLRARAAEPAVLAAVIDFVAAHEADLVAAADSLGLAPQSIIAAGRTLAGDAHEESWG
jgi:hypothetical protein